MLKDKIDFATHVNEWKETGGTMADYCRTNEISYQTFMYHASRMKKKENAVGGSNGFIPIAMGIKVAEKISGIEYHFANGSYFVFPSGCSVQMIKALIG